MGRSGRVTDAELLLGLISAEIGKLGGMAGMLREGLRPPDSGKDTKHQLIDQSAPKANVVSL